MALAVAMVMEWPVVSRSLHRQDSQIAIAAPWARLILVPVWDSCHCPVASLFLRFRIFIGHRPPPPSLKRKSLLQIWRKGVFHNGGIVCPHVCRGISRKDVHVGPRSHSEQVKRVAAIGMGLDVFQCGSPPVWPPRLSTGCAGLSPSDTGACPLDPPSAASSASQRVLVAAL